MHLNPFEMFKILGVESRIKIIELLKSRGPLGVNSIAQELGITPPAVSQHLKVLKQAGFVSSERKGYYIPYSIDIAALEHCRCMLIEVCSCDCSPRRGHKRHTDREAELDSLVRYKKELEKQLKKIRERITKIKEKKK